MSIETLIASVSKAIPTSFMKEIGATNPSIVSGRSIRFDIPTTPTGINRVKVTLQPDGDMRLRTYKVEEVEDVPSISPGSLMGAIKTLAGIEAAKESGAE